MNQTTPQPRRPVIALMTDFGLSDGYVGVMKGVIAGITPEAHIIDITHEIAPQNIFSGAWILASAYRYFPRIGTVFVCVVDPGVGSPRGAIALHAGDWFFVGPDNGLFSYVLGEQPVHAACTLSNSTYHLPQVSSTFHGRDIFAPVAAHLARGIALNELGTLIDPATLQRIDLPGAINRAPTGREASIDGQIIHIDHFGNLISNIPFTMVPDLFSDPQGHLVFPNSGIEVNNRQRFFAEGSDDGEPFLYVDSSGYIGIAVRNGNAAKALSIGYGTPISLVTSVQ